MAITVVPDVTTPTSSFGAANTTTAGGFSAHRVIDSERFRELDRRSAYYNCTQHDYKRFDFDGRVIQSGGGMSATQPLLSSEKFASYIPLRSRRPSSPYRLPKVITNTFTKLVFGENRFPDIRIDGDSNTQDFVRTISKVGRLPMKMIRVRNFGGSTGTGTISWAYVDGRPRFEVHNPRNIFVHSWEDREARIPRHVTEVYTFPRDEWDGQKKKYVRNLYWYRRDWTQDQDIVFKTVLFDPKNDPMWIPDVENSATHNDKLAHFVWIQNTPCEEDDGLPDYDGLYDNFDALDTLLSVIVRGATLNLDPTLKLKLDPDLVARMGIKKGSDNALIVGKDGDAEYLELGGASIEAGINLFNAKRRAILEVAECVIPDPSEIAAQGVSSVTIKALYSPSLGKADLFREQYGDGMTRLLEPMIVIAQKASRSRIIVQDDDGNDVEADLAVKLPPKIEKTPKLDADGLPTGEDVITKIERSPGEGGDLDLDWPQYFPPTPDDQSKIATTLTAATGGKAFLGAETATSIMAAAFGRDGADEWTKMQKAHNADETKQLAMFGDQDGSVGGQVTHEAQLPNGAKIKRTFGPPTESESESESEDPAEKKTPAKEA